MSFFRNFLSFFGFDWFWLFLIWGLFFGVWFFGLGWLVSSMLFVVLRIHNFDFVGDPLEAWVRGCLPAEESESIYSSLAGSLYFYISFICLSCYSLAFRSAYLSRSSIIFLFSSFLLLRSYLYRSYSYSSLLLYCSFLSSSSLSRVNRWVRRAGTAFCIDGKITSSLSMWMRWKYKSIKLNWYENLKMVMNGFILFCTLNNI